MAGRLVVTTLNNDTGVLATQNGMTGIPKAWVNFNGTGTVAIRGSFNVSSVTDNGTGDYRINFTSAMLDVNYAVAGAVGGASSSGYMRIAENTSTALQTTSFNVNVISSASPGNIDLPYVTAAVFSS
jgi:hypothetical protein